MRSVRRILGLVALTTGLGLAQFLIIPGMEPNLSVGLPGLVLAQLGFNALCLGSGTTPEHRTRRAELDPLSTVLPG